MKLKPGPMYEEIFGVKEAGEPAARSAVTFVPNSANPATETKSCTRPSESTDIESADIERESDADAAPWVVKVLTFLENNGQALLSSICAHYRIEFDGDFASVGKEKTDELRDRWGQYADPDLYFWVPHGYGEFREHSAG